MAKIDYLGIEQEMAEILRSTLPDGYTVCVEEEILFSPEMTPWVGIYLDRREALDTEQSISAGRRTAYRLWLIVWVWCFSLDRLEAVRMRDDAVAEVEVALMGSRTLNDKVRMMWLRGGRLPSSRVRNDQMLGQTQQSFIAGGEILVSADVSATI